MRLGKYLSGLTKPELEDLKELLNLTEDENKVFEELSKGWTKTHVSMSCLVSLSTVDNRIRAINNKIIRLKEVMQGVDEVDGK